MYQKLDFVLGFFIIIIFLSSVVVTLTILYLSRSKSKDQSEKNDNKSEIPRNGRKPESNLEPIKLSVREKNDNKSEIPRNGKKPKSNLEPIKLNAREKNTAKNTKFPISLTEQTMAEKASLKMSESIESNITNTSDSNFIQSTENKAEKLIINKLSGPKSGSKPGLSEETQQAKQMSIEVENHSNPKTLDYSKTSGGILLSPLAEENKTNNIENTDGQKLVPNSEIAVNLAILPTKQNLESEVKQPMADENKKDHPRVVQPDMGFSELFTEDTEESQASKLSKDLNDVDTNDILTMSQNLISQFKGRRPAIE
jgi:hypothetical protein